MNGGQKNVAQPKSGKLSVLFVVAMQKAKKEFVLGLKAETRLWITEIKEIRINIV